MRIAALLSLLLGFVLASSADVRAEQGPPGETAPSDDTDIDSTTPGNTAPGNAAPCPKGKQGEKCRKARKKAAKKAKNQAKKTCPKGKRGATCRKAKKCPKGKKGKKCRKARKAKKGKIVEIVVEDNTKTTDDTVILVSGISIGDRFNPQMVDDIKASMVNSGLFKRVDVGYLMLPHGGYRVMLSAKDKHSWIIAPTYYNQPTNKGVGLGFGENNLFGKNEKLLLYGQIATGDSFFIGAYIDPSIANSRFGWQIDTYLLRERVIEYRPPQEYKHEPEEIRESKLVYLNLGLTLSVNFTRRLSLSARMRGAKVSYQDVQAKSDNCEDLVPGPCNFDQLVIPEPGASGYDVSTEVKLEYDSRANWYGVTHGDRYLLTGEYALPQLYSDFEYWYTTLTLQRARRYFSRHNLIVKGMLGYGENLPFQREFTAGGVALRGFKNDQYRGDVLASASVEYSVPVITVKGIGLRAHVFADTAYTAFLNADPEENTFRDYLPGQQFEDDALSMAPWKNTVGLGIRLHMRQIVLPLLGVDFGYGIERNAAEIYLAIGLTE